MGIFGIFIGIFFGIDIGVIFAIIIFLSASASVVSGGPSGSIAETSRWFVEPCFDFRLV